MGKTKIEWTDYSFNPWWGCVKISPGCAHCYAETFARRAGYDVWGVNKPRRFFGDRHWDEVLAWNRKAQKEGMRKRVFCGSMCDVFEQRDDLVKHRDRLWMMIEQTPMLDWLLLTKRPENLEHMLPERWSSWGYFNEHDNLPDHSVFPQNVWIGISAENQEWFDVRWPVLESVGWRWYVPVLFVSAEPLLGPLSLKDDLCGFIEHEEDNTIEIRGIDWVIVGGESGPSARPMHSDWVRKVHDDCAEVEIPFFFKQWGEYTRAPGGGFIRVGKKRAGHMLDGKEWQEWPR